MFTDDSRTRERRAQAQAALQRALALWAHFAEEQFGLTELWDLTLVGPSRAFTHGDQLGLRIEDIRMITADGADHFGDWQTGPEGP